MKKVMLLCNAGMSSSLMAKKVSEYFYSNGKDIKVDATTTANSEEVFGNKDYSMVLVSPQVRMLYEEYRIKAKETGKKIAQVTVDAYSPTPNGVKKMADIILSSYMKL